MGEGGELHGYNTDAAGFVGSEDLFPVVVNCAAGEEVGSSHLAFEPLCGVIPYLEPDT